MQTFFASVIIVGIAVGFYIVLMKGLGKDYEDTKYIQSATKAVIYFTIALFSVLMTGTLDITPKQEPLVNLILFNSRLVAIISCLEGISNMGKYCRHKKDSKKQSDNNMEMSDHKEEV